jgi:hypothetical protein
MTEQTFTTVELIRTPEGMIWAEIGGHKIPLGAVHGYTRFAGFVFIGKDEASIETREIAYDAPVRELEDGTLEWAKEIRVTA